MWDKKDLEYLDSYSQHLKSLNYSDVTIKNYISTVEEFYELNVSPEEYMKELYKKGNSPNTRSNKYYYIKSWIIYLNKIGLKRNFFNFKPPRREYFIPKVLSEEEIKRMLDACDTTKLSGIRAFALISFLVETGCRISEAINIHLDDDKFSHITIESKKVKPNLTIKEYKIIFKNTKTKTERINYLSKILVEEILFKYYEMKKVKSNYLFSNLHNGEKLSRNNAWQIITDIAKKAKIKRKVYPHIFRHTKVTKLVNAGLSNEQIMAIVGFKDPRQVRTYYHISNKVLRLGLKNTIIDLKKYIEEKRINKNI